MYVCITTRTAVSEPVHRKKIVNNKPDRSWPSHTRMLHCSNTSSWPMFGARKDAGVRVSWKRTRKEDKKRGQQALSNMACQWIGAWGMTLHDQRCGLAPMPGSQKIDQHSKVANSSQSRLPFDEQCELFVLLEKFRKPDRSGGVRVWSQSSDLDPTRLTLRIATKTVHSSSEF